MKKALALVLAFVMVLALSVTAFAGSPVAEPGIPKGAIKVVNPKGEVIRAISDEDVDLFYIGAANDLEGEKLDAFNAASDAAKAVEGKEVIDIFWLEPKAGVLAEGQGLQIDFTFPEGDVTVTVNGAELAVEKTPYEPDEARIGAVVEGHPGTVNFYEFGTVAFLLG